MYKGFVVSREAVKDDPHLAEGCSSCHAGDESASTREDAHTGLVARPSDEPERCAECHPDISENYSKSLHYTASGLKHGVAPRFSEKERKQFESTVFEKSCRSCHASCGDCHVKGPRIAEVTTGLLDGHRFVRKDDEKTCGFCHGGRVYPEFTGQYGVVKDVHYEKGMTCTDCHSMQEMHGDGTAYTGRRQVADRPNCKECHTPAAAEKVKASGRKPGPDMNVSDKAKQAHADHDGLLSCQTCHALSTYKHCTNCHLGKGAESKSGFIQGRNPSNPDQVTTLRTVPAARDTFASVGIAMENYDKVPNYWDAAPHVIRKTTERTGNCVLCHLVKNCYLKPSTLLKDGAKANEKLVYQPKPIPTK
ncbi:hypothetical protein GO013_10440 [Pseudodesulfovibrio sp. JC047]|uniref:cytochrome c3 family protein n=1 Tax=Pseudodesulfovibrio sp. JC047 TaxID=2683199 RepID=UPI0013CF5F70|nr:cytochrome c3 family protein [Pseudodesulfovibrio sp. JC047]NDV19838.1 hypothetical protein [Pseudodesulfovibrio sp. JC047]